MKVYDSVIEICMEPHFSRITKASSETSEEARSAA